MGLVPLLIAEQNKIIDRAEVFLPYAALEIATNCRPTTVVLQLLSASGQALEEERIETTLGGFYRDEPVASPQTREVWGRDFETDSAIERTQLLICGKRYETLTLCVQALDSDDQEQIIFEQQISPNFSVQPVALPKVEAPSSAKFLEYFVKTADAQILCGSLEAVRAQSRD